MPNTSNLYHRQTYYAFGANSNGAVPGGVQAGTLAGSRGYGSANCTGTAASFDFPPGVATDAPGNIYKCYRLFATFQKPFSAPAVITTVKTTMFN